MRKQVAKPLELDDGWHVGPLFIVQKKRAPKRTSKRSHGMLRRADERRACPDWADRKAIAAVFREARRLTRETGIVHSGDHIVPLNHPLVCGLHVAFNLRVIPLAENVRKSNNSWPDMPNEQIDLFGADDEIQDHR